MPGPKAGNSLSLSLRKTLMLDSQPKASLLTDHIIVGSREDACDYNILQDLGVTHVLNAADGLGNGFPHSFIYYNLPLQDRDDFPVSKYFEVSSSFMKRVEGLGGRVMIHCVAGVSRSVTLVIAHLILAHRMTLRDAYNHVVTHRPYICPNNGFKLALAQLEVRGDRGGFDSAFFGLGTPMSVCMFPYICIFWYLCKHFPLSLWVNLYSVCVCTKKLSHSTS